MDVFYEESAVTQNAASEIKRYRIFDIIAKVFLGIGIFGLILAFSIIPLNMMVGWLIFCFGFFGAWFGLTRLRNRYNVNFDYTFVSGELRISRVINGKKRKLLVKIQAEDILQMGDVDGNNYDNLAASPDTKTVLCTSNIQSAEGKFFLYILAAISGAKKLYVLECRETLLMHMLRFTKRTVLESGYVSQEKKVQ